MPEGKRSENHVMWHHKQTDINSNSNSISRTQTDGSWLSSPRACVTQHLFQDTVDDSKSVSAWPALPGYSTTHSPKLNNDPLTDPVEKLKKVDTASGYRLFGIELINRSTSSPPVEKANAQPNTVSNGSTEGRSTLSATDSDLKSGLSKDSKERQLGQQQVLLKEIQSKQNCSSSTRSRTKVLDGECFIYIFKICIPFLLKSEKLLFLFFFEYAKGSNAGGCCWSRCGLKHVGRI